MLKLALLGKNISHSLSPKLYQEIYGEEQVKYRLLDFQNEMTIPSLEVLFKDLDGLNITAPYKQHFLDSVKIFDKPVEKLNAINCIARGESGFVATNTDYTALLKLLPEMTRDRYVVILGSGVMARVTSVACEHLKIKYEQWSRSETPNLFQQMDFEKVSDKNILIVNCCAREFVFRAEIPARALFWDMNYAHKEHELIFARDRRYIDGLNLLRAQAKDAAAFWSRLKN